VPAISCILWWLVLGALLGLLLSWLIGARSKRPLPRATERVVEKFVDKVVDNPAHLARIRALEDEVALIPSLRSQIAQFQSAAPTVVEKVVEKIVPDTQGLAQRDQQLREMQTRIDEFERRSRMQVQTIADRDEELRRMRLPPIIDMQAAKAAGLALKSADDLEIVEGIGPKIAELLRAGGISTFMELATATPERIRAILDKAGPQYRIADPGTWPEQADLAAHNRWAALKKLQDVLIAGVRVDTSATDAQLKDARAQLAAREAELQRLRAPVSIDLAAAKEAGFNVRGADDLEIIEGIGPKIAELLHADGVKDFAALAAMTPAQIQPILDKGGANFRMANPDTWPEQADLAARNRWRTLKSLQDMLNAGNR
jgi:predicted flap endonuclease-1-like 5' DNA nuclease